MARNLSSGTILTKLVAVLVFAEKLREAFAVQKLLTTFQQKIAELVYGKKKKA